MPPVTRWFAILLLLHGTAGARTLSVGPNQPFPGPSSAAHVAQDGDIVLIEPGEYYDCAVWTQNHLLIAGTGPNVVITDTACQGKALFVITGNDTTIRGLTLARARVPDGNGAGIRQEGQGLTLERVWFVNDEVGLLAGAASSGAIRISDCGFEGGGSEGGGDGSGRATFAVLVNAVSLLRIQGSSFKNVKGGQINSLAVRTELSGNQIGTGAGERPDVAVVSAGGHLVMEDNVLSIGPTAPRLAAAVLVTGQDAPRLRGNRLLNATGRTAALLLDWSGGDPVLEANQVGTGDTALSTDGLWRHRAAELYHGTKDAGHALAGQAKRRLLALMGH